MRQGQSVWRSLLGDSRALFGILVIAFSFFIALFGAHLRPDSSIDANQQHLAIARLAPGDQVSFLALPASSEVEPFSFFDGILFGGYTPEFDYTLCDSVVLVDEEVHTYWKDEEGRQFSLEYLYGIVPNLSEKSRIEIIPFLKSNYIETNTYRLGTDSFGRDMMSRLMAGTLVSLSVGFVSVLISLIIGIGLGAVAGYYGSWVDDVIMWLINVIWSIPTLLMVIAITLVMGKGFIQVFVAIGLTMWVEVARIVRGQFLSMRNLPYIEAGQSMGYSSARLILKHLLPNAMGPVIVIAAANFASAILIEAGLSFLGIGTQIPTPSWGGMIKEHYSYITTDMAYLAILPGICITTLVLSFMLIGNRLRDVLDVKG